MSVCPVSAVEVSQSFGVLLFFATSFQMSALVLAFFANAYGWAIFLNGSVIAVVIQYMFMLTIVAVLYRLFWVATQIRVVNQLFTYTTLTHFWRRYLEPRTSVGELKGNPKKNGQEAREP